MARHHVERVLHYAPDPLFALVGDVARYPDFLPWVTSTAATAPEPLEGGADRLEAEATVGFSFLRERFSTGVRRDPAARTIEVSLLRGPFRRLLTRWAFRPEGAGARVVFDIDYAFKAPLLDAVLAANFDRAVAKLIPCFEARAADLYGAPAPQGAAPLPPS